MKPENFISIIIPNYNGEATIGKCLEAAFSSEYQNFEVVVVDDFSHDNSVKIIKKYPCRLIMLDKHSGASKTRNVGAQNSNGKILFFIDADCLLQENTLALVNKTIEKYSNDTIIGGTYTKVPYDDKFFSTFQSVFINYSETKNKDAPNYIATHAMVIDRETFIKTGRFCEDYFIPILEDVEFSHRLRGAGYKLVISPEIFVRHIFNFTLLKSLRNAAKKSMYWTIYSINNRDLLSDSGTASIELKVAVMSYFINLLLIIFGILFKRYFFFIPLFFIFMITLYINRGLISAFYETRGLLFAIASLCYYTMVYPIGVCAGAVAGTVTYFLKFRKMGKSE